jgi:CheY-like chemotaxis protein
MHAQLYRRETGHSLSAKKPANARILVVEDDDLLRCLQEAVLSSAGYGTQGAVDGEEALVMLATEEFDLVLTDRSMPRLDGCGLVRALRAAGSRIPVIMVSGSLMDGGELPADVADEVAIALAKPASTGELLESVAQLLRRKEGEPPPVRIAEVFERASAAPRATFSAMLNGAFAPPRGCDGLAD